MSSAHFLIELFVFWVSSSINPLKILNTNPLSDMAFVFLKKSSSLTPFSSVLGIEGDKSS